MIRIPQLNRCRGAILFGVFVALQPVQESAADMSAERSGTALSGGQAAVLAPQLLDASGTWIGTVSISSGSIFDLDNPDENKMLYRLANRLHIKTRPDVIEQQLLFKPGDRFSAQALEESERILRANRYIQEVSIKPVLQDNGEVDVNIETTDVWTLMPKLAVSRSGGKNEAAIGLKEMNLFGSGTAVEVLYKSDVDRDYRVVKYVDRNLGKSWCGLRLDFADNSDGYSQFLEIGKPFYSLDSRNALGFSVLVKDSINAFYERGEAISEYQDKATGYEIYRGWSKGLRDGWTRRYTAGLAYDDHRFSAATDSAYPASVVPQNRELLTPFVGFEIVEDRYEKSRNHDQLDRVEDRFLGTRLSARLGVARAGAGSDRDAWLLNVSAQTGFGNSDTSSLLLATQLGGRIEPDGARNVSLNVSAKYYKHQSDRRRLYMSLSGTYGRHLDLDQYLVLGGDTGLRGYPLRFQSGDKRALFTVEQRFFTDWYPFRLFHVGGAVFFDAGRAWGNSPAGASGNQLLKNVGFGLRIGSSRSGLGRMTHVDLALPLDDKDGKDGIDGIQFLVSTRKSF